MTAIQEQGPDAMEKAAAPSNKEYNFEMIRRQLEQEKRAKEELEQKAIQMARELEEIKQTQQRPAETEEDEPYVDHKALNRKLSQWEQKIDQKIEKKAEEKARALVEAERKNNYLKSNNDFNDVMSMDNIQKFAEKHPGLAEGILSMPDSFERQKLVYENIKALNVHKKEEPKQSIQEVISSNRKNLYYQPSSTAAPPFAGQSDFSPAGQKNAYAKLKELKARIGLP